jgi:hypothetical protein
VELRGWGVAFGIVLSLTACTPSRMAYLREAVNQTTQDEITTKLGPTAGGTRVHDWGDRMAV